jgi:hypothetical protein
MAAILPGAAARLLPVRQQWAASVPAAAAVTPSLLRVLGGSGGEGASGRGFPFQDTRFRLSQLPPLGLLAPVVMATQRREPALAGDPAHVPRNGMVQVAAGGWAAAARRGALGATGPDQVLELAAGLVPGFGMVMVAAAPGNRVQPDPQGPQVVLGPGIGRGLGVRAAAGAAAGAGADSVWWRGAWGRWCGWRCAAW